MSKPDDIPQDVLETAKAVWIKALADGTPDAAEVIARAILAERERCAKVADAANKHLASMQGECAKNKERHKSRDFESMRIAAAQIAAAIRGGTTPIGAAATQSDGGGE